MKDLHSTAADALSPLAVYQRYLEQGQLAYQVDPATGEAVFHPRVARARAAGLQWRVSQGLGTVYATTAIPARDADDYNVALIALDEGFRMMSRVEGVPAREVRIGMRVRVRIAEPANEPRHPVFEVLP